MVSMAINLPGQKLLTLWFGAGLLLAALALTPAVFVSTEGHWFGLPEGISSVIWLTHGIGQVVLVLLVAVLAVLTLIAGIKGLLAIGTGK